MKITFKNATINFERAVIPTKLLPQATHTGIISGTGSINELQGWTVYEYDVTSVSMVRINTVFGGGQARIYVAKSSGSVVSSGDLITVPSGSTGTEEIANSVDVSNADTLYVNCYTAHSAIPEVYVKPDV